MQDRTDTTNPNTTKPFWLTTPCPKWCTEHHKDAHTANEREHYSDMLSAVGLTLADAYEYVANDQVHAQQASLGVYVEQGYRETGPRIVVEPDHKEHGSRYDLTPAEAIVLGRALIEAGELADGAA